MIIEKVLGNTHDLPPGPDPYVGLHRETVVLPSAQLVRRIQRVTTDHGKELGIRLPAGSGDLRDGDILHVAGTNMIVVSVLPTDVLVIAPRSIHERIRSGMSSRPRTDSESPATASAGWSR